MFYIAHLEYCDEDTYETEKYSVITYANNYINAVTNIVNQFGDKWIEKITLLEPVTDNNVLYLSNCTIEKALLANEHNSFT